MPRYNAVSLSSSYIDVAIFDLDGVLADTTQAHSAAWKVVFDDLLARTSTADQTHRPFDARSDYLAYVDGRSREDGVRQFLASRRIVIPERSEDAMVDSVKTLAARKDALVQVSLQTTSKALPGAESTLRDLRSTGIKIGVASSSANCELVLEVIGLARFVDVRVDGVVAAELGLPGKPDPALFLEAAHRLGADPRRAALFEDALPGVEAGLRGGFAIVVGVDRGNQEIALRQKGAHAVIRDLTQVTVRV